MNHPSSVAQQGLPPPLAQPQLGTSLQHPRSTGYIQQHHRPNSPHQLQHPSLRTTQPGAYVPQTASHNLPQNSQSSYVGAPSGLPQQHGGESTFFGAHQSPYSANSAGASYASAEPSDTMAAQAVLNRQSYGAPMPNYHTQHANSPASMHSPQTDSHGRPLYSMPSMAQSLYYPQQYQMPPQQPSYGQHQSTAHHPSMAPAPGMLLSHPQPQHHGIPQQPAHTQQAVNNQSSASMMDSKPSPPSLQRPPSAVGGNHGNAQTSSGPAPGPIPATTPLVVHQDNNGVQWIAFEYSRDRVKMEYTIRCDVESIDVDSLSQDFKTSNCVYPRACVGKDQYKGNRHHYETECNTVGWALAQLNPNLREKRGLIQRAVDSWRNSNQDVRLRSRRVRRMAKLNNRKAQMQPSAAIGGPQGSPTAGLQPPQDMPGSSYSQANAQSFQQSPQLNHGHLSSLQAQPRYGQNFSPSYPSHRDVGYSTLPSSLDRLDTSHHPGPSTAIPARASTPEKGTVRGVSRAQGGAVGEAKRRKFILVDDTQRGTRVRVRVTLDQVKLDDMPDAHLKSNAVYPRSYFARQMRSVPGVGEFRDDYDDTDDHGDPSMSSTTLVQTTVSEGIVTRLPAPRMTKSKRARELALNELGYQMSWGQARTFNGRRLFLQRSLDAYRNTIQSTVVTPDNAVLSLETRPGKRKWLEWSQRSLQS